MKATFTVLGIVVFGLIAWLALAPQKATHLLIENARAQPLGTEALSVVMDFNNQGAPDRLITVASSLGDAALLYPYEPKEVPIPTGRSALALDAAYIRLAPDEVTIPEGTLIPLTLTFERAGKVAVKATVAAAQDDPHASMVGMHDMDEMKGVDMFGHAPTIAIKAEPAQDGWRVQIVVENFIFAPDEMGMAHAHGFGHGHIYVGGIKLGRVFGSEFMIGALPSGTHEIRVTLNTNDHRAYMIGDDPISATTRIVVD